MWVIDAHDCGVEPGAPGRVRVSRMLLQAGLAAANIGMKFVAMVREQSMVVTVVYQDDKPWLLRQGVIDQPQPRFISLAWGDAGRMTSVPPFEPVWMFDLPLRWAP